MHAATWFAKSKKAVVMGNFNPICVPRFSAQIDYELTKHFGLVENDADFEDLQFDGVLASLGNAWNMVVKDRVADQTLSPSFKQPLEYEFIDIRSDSVAYVGSLINIGVIEPLINWLNMHAEQRSDVTIYTCFAGQAQIIQAALQPTTYAQVPTRLIQQPCFTASKINIFIPVYTAADPGPYIFDHGTEILDQLLVNTQEQLVIIGDMSIFKPELHSASGKFAQAVYAPIEIEKDIIITEEANCV
jgi:hypothetical protein